MKTLPINLCIKYTFYGNASRNEIATSYLREKREQDFMNRKSLCYSEFYFACAYKYFSIPK